MHSGGLQDKWGQEDYFECCCQLNLQKSPWMRWWVEEMYKEPTAGHLPAGGTEHLLLLWGEVAQEWMWSWLSQCLLGFSGVSLVWLFLSKTLSSAFQSGKLQITWVHFIRNHLFKCCKQEELKINWGNIQKRIIWEIGFKTI